MPCYILNFAITHIPIITGLLFVVTCGITYAWSVSLHHVPAMFPFISDTGTFAPESCFFGEMLNIGAILIAVTVYLRHLELRDHVAEAIFPRFTWLSRISLCLGNIHYIDWLIHDAFSSECCIDWLIDSLIFGDDFAGLIAAFGVSLVANFQEVNQIELHILGAFMVFGLGAIYMYIETYITYKIHPGEESRRICHFRLICAVLGSLSFISMIVTIAVAYHYYKPLGGRGPVNWQPVSDFGSLSWFFGVLTAIDWLIDAKLCNGGSVH